MLAQRIEQRRPYVEFDRVADAVDADVHAAILYCPGFLLGNDRRNASFRAGKARTARPSLVRLGHLIGDDGAAPADGTIGAGRRVAEGLALQLRFDPPVTPNPGGEPESRRAGKRR